MGVVLVIEGLETRSTLERRQFNIEQDQEVTATSAGKKKSQKAVTNEIQAIIRQITASVTFLPLLEEPCTFDLLIYAYTEADVPTSWEETDPKNLENRCTRSMRWSRTRR